MPSPRQILDGLTAISNQMTSVAILWHALVAAGLAGVAGGWRPSQRVAAAVLVLPLASVAAAALAFGNPFNAATFIALAAALGMLGLRLPGAGHTRAPAWRFAVGVVMACFGLAYPHFLETSSPLKYLYAAPTGLVPCPSLSLVIGLALVADGLGSRAWSLTLGGAGLFYGLFGMLRLGVYIDAALVVGAVALLVRGVAHRASASV